MKKIVYSILVALVLSVILALLVPRWLFKGDARRTYQNDAARVDVSFVGYLKNGRVGAEGNDMNISQPAWLSNESYQGTMVEFPVSYRTKSYRIKLSPRGRRMGEGCHSHHRIPAKVYKEVNHRSHYIINQSVDDAVPLTAHTSTEAGTKPEQRKCV